MNNMYIAGDIIVYEGSDPIVLDKLSTLGYKISDTGLTVEYRIALKNQEYVLSDRFQQLMQNLGVTIKPWEDVVNKLIAVSQKSGIEIPISDLHIGGGLATLLLTHF